MTNEQLGQLLYGITQWIMMQPRKCLLDDYHKVFRYVAFAWMNNKMSVIWENNLLMGVVFHWTDSIELIELKAQENRQQFEFAPMRKGNAIFVGEVIGKRDSVGKCYKILLAQHPHLVMCPIYTYRHGKLTTLSHKLLERICYRKEEV